MIVIAILGGSLAAIPAIMLCAFAVAAAIVQLLSRKSVDETSRSSARRKRFLVETLSNARAIKYSAGITNWQSRFRELAADSAMANLRGGQLSAAVTTISHVLMVSAGLATLAVGALKVIDCDMTVGALVAVMILVWRVLGPLQTGFVASSHFEQVRTSIGQIDELMKLRPERDPYSRPTAPKKLTGRLNFNNVSMRYHPNADPALLGATFQLSPGTIAAVLGTSGSGKSTILKLVASLYQPQAGCIVLDGVDIRQIDPLRLRTMIGYVPQVCHLFRGTIAQNLRLAHPTASDDDLRAATDEAALLEDFLALPEGFNTRIGDYKSGQLPSGFRQRLSLARAYLMQAPLLLLDEPVNNLGHRGDQAFMETIEKLRGETTVLLVTHRPSHALLADQIIFMHCGRVIFTGTYDAALKKIPWAFQ